MQIFIKRLCLTILMLLPTYLIALEPKEDNPPPLSSSNNSNSNKDNKENTDPEEKSQIVVIGRENITDSENYFNNVNKINNDSPQAGKANTDANDLLKNIAGVTVSTASRNIIDIRGQGTDDAKTNVQVFMDDVPMNLIDYSHYFQGYNVIPANIISSVEVIPGGGAVIYGNGTQGGVVKYSTNFMSSKPRENFVSFGYGSFSATRRALSLSNNKLLEGRLMLSINYSAENNKAYRRGENNNVDYYSLAAEYQINDNNRIGYSFSDYTEEGKYAMVAQISKINKDWRASGTLYNRDTENKVHSLKYLGKFDNIEISNDFFNTYRYWRAQSSSDLGKFWFSSYGNKLKAKINYLNNGSFILIGNDLAHMNEDVKVATRVTNHWIYNKDQIALFALNKTYIGDFYSTQGYRYNIDYWHRQSPIGGNKQYDLIVSDYYSKKINNSYEFSLGYETNNSNTWIKVESGFTAPNASELTDIVGGLYIINNVKYSTFINYEIGNKTNITDNLSFTGALYYSDTKDQVYREYLSGLSDAVTLNAEKVLRKGIEIGVNYKMDRTNAFINVAYIDSKDSGLNVDKLKQYFGQGFDEELQEIIDTADKYDGLSLLHVPPVSIVLGASFEIVNNLVLTNTVNYLSDYNGAFARYEDPIYDGARVLVDVDLRYSKKEYELGLGIKNLLDERYFVYRSSTSTIVGMERSYYMDFKYKF